MQAYSGRLAELDAQVLGISCDSNFSHVAFAKDSGVIDFPLLSDFWPHGTAAQRFGVFDDELGMSQRSVFVLDRKGVVRWAYHAARAEQRDIAQIVAAVEAIQTGG